MTELVLMSWVWWVVGGFALYLYVDELPESTGLLTALLLTVTWPVWSAYRVLYSHRNQSYSYARIPVRAGDVGNVSRRR